MYGFLILVAIVIAIKFIGTRLIPIAMPSSKLKGLAAGLIGGFAGSLITRQYHLWDWALVAGTNLLGAALGAIMFILLLGLAPFIKILLRKA